MPTHGSSLNLKFLTGKPAQMPVTAPADDIAGSVVVTPDGIPTIAHASHEQGDRIAGNIGRAVYEATQTFNVEDLPPIAPGDIWYDPGLNTLANNPTGGNKHFGIALQTTPPQITFGQSQKFLVLHCPDGRTT